MRFYYKCGPGFFTGTESLDARNLQKQKTYAPMGGVNRDITSTTPSVIAGFLASDFSHTQLTSPVPAQGQIGQQHGQRRRIFHAK